MKTQHCDQCKHATMRALPKPTLICAMLHKPRFYAPVYWLKDSWGWKRKCEDFLEQPVPEPEGQAITFAKEELAAPVQEFVCSTGLCHYKPAAPDLQAELEATNKQVEILSDALAESRREVAALKAVQEPVNSPDDWSDWKVTPPAAPVQEFVCSTGLCHYKPAAGARGMDGCIG